MLLRAASEERGSRVQSCAKGLPRCGVVIAPCGQVLLRAASEQHGSGVQPLAGRFCSMPPASSMAAECGPV